MKAVRYLLQSLMVAAILLSLSTAPVLAAVTSTGELFTVSISSGVISFSPTVSHDRVRLTVLAPDGEVSTTVFGGDTSPAISTMLLPGSQRDGYFTYELRVLTPTDGSRRGSGDSAAGGEIQVPRQPLIQNGHFLVSNGMIVVPAEASPETSPVRAAPATGGVLVPQDVVHADDAVITGSMCVGFDCLTDGTENFGFDTIKMKENNLRIFFDDTSTTAGFPANDWRIVTNDSSSGGGNYFAIEDSTGAKTPFKVEAGARTSALYVSSSGRVGFGTATPVLNQHIAAGDTPAIRFDQDGTGGWSPQVWDVAGNETNFFVRDTTGGSRLPFRIQPGAPSNSISICANGAVVIGGWCN